MDVKLKYLLDHLEETVRVIRTGYFFVDVQPQAKQSVSFGKGHAFTSKKKRAYLKFLEESFREQWIGPPLASMLRVTILYSFKWTIAQKAFVSLGWSLTDKRIDLDNLLKPAKDSLQKAGILSDDSQVVEVRARKIRYLSAGIALKIDEIVPEREHFDNYFRGKKAI